MDRDELAAWLRLHNTPGIGNARARILINALGPAPQIFEQSLSQLSALVGHTAAKALLGNTATHATQIETCHAWLETEPHTRRLLALGTPGYPAILQHMPDAPILLYAIGPQAAWQHNWINRPGQVALAVVGSRNPTPQGSANAQQFSMALAEAGLSVVSGLAQGIDGMAHEGALMAADRELLATIAVVGTGLDRVYPSQHRDLAHRIGQRGLLLSEYSLGTGPLPHNFPRRNRIISGLSLGTLVVEAALKSGSLITAQLATEQGREVFAIPGSIHNTQSRGCHALIRQGAKLVECVQDVLDELPGALRRIPSAACSSLHSTPLSASNSDPYCAAPHHAALLNALQDTPLGLDALCQQTGLEIAVLQVQLMELELDGSVARLPGGVFQRLRRI